jgi:RNA 2',3'-cyclic 3'-phosphodiesterase
MKDTVRTFIAVETSATVRQRAAALIETLASKGVKVSWAKPQHLHLTLKFLDEIRWNMVAEVTEAVQRAARTIEPFGVEIRGAGAFASLARPRTLWLGTAAGSEALAALHAALESALKPLGFPKEHRRFSAHLTLGRVRDENTAARKLGPVIQQHADFLAGEFLVRELVVFSSELTPQGPIYEAIGHGTLGK